MTFRRGGAGKRRDASEADIVDALRGVGCLTWQVSGRGLPDLIVYRPMTGRWWVAEIKSKGGRLSKVQAEQQAPWPTWRTVSDALVCMGITR